MLDVNSYTVGWICAVEVELVAAQELLDEEHDTDELELPVNDNNSYALGRIGKHNVVIAAMPHKRYGLVSAATVARDMSQSFPNVRIGLMVGIGGGVPSPRHDIRLGDIVVSSPGYGNGGVLQFDYGKAIQDREFRMTSHLNQSPQLFLTALAQLNAQYSRKGHGIERAIQGVCENNPRLRWRFCRPDLSTDRLYSKTHVHQGSEGCAIGCNEDGLIVRQPRAETENNPAIHHGIIASANKLMKDAELRDKLAAEHDILCFEMEAAGLMNHFPCLVVRGIWDYSDSHKNGVWQGYAAMVAAVYAKDLLKKIAPNKVEAEKRMIEILNKVQDNIHQVQLKVESLNLNTHSHRVGSWLSPPDPSTNYNNALKSRHPGSGKWLLKHPAYLGWESERNSFLWLTGIPGCGKTVLSSTIIEHLMKEGASNILYFYFDFNDKNKQEFDKMLRSLANQIYNSCRDARKQLDTLYTSHAQGSQQPTSDLLHATLSRMMQQAENVHIILDALDECPKRNEHQSGGLLSWIHAIHQSHPNVHLLLTSRPEHDIMTNIQSWARDQDIISIQNNLIQEDIDAYVRGRLRGIGILSQRWRTRPDVRNEIEDALMKQSNGMFRWAACQLDELEGCIAPREVRRALDNLPKTLEETYSRIIANILEQGHRQLTIRILQFLTYSQVPLSVEELIDIIARFSKYCSGLVIVSVSRRKRYRLYHGEVTELRLAHFSGKEYLVSDRLTLDIAHDLERTNATTTLANVCSVYLLNIAYTHPYCNVVVMLLVQGIDVQANSGGGCVRALWIASYRGTDKTAKMLFRQGADDFNHDDGSEYTSECDKALPPASRNGHKNTIESLINKCSDIHALDTYNHYRSALQVSTSFGHECVIGKHNDKDARIYTRDWLFDGNKLYVTDRVG
ncbi:hypothetical protein F5Y18DRAFT_417729 [Xylariaceae sp. FL1019]|nr:hypothetical protein F5Y18DRAFT_417729 [Xylariaceae sp. FL1019]